VAIWVVSIPMLVITVVPVAAARTGLGLKSSSIAVTRQSP
jgi:hypothetical protein